jgi:hypothetical protein
MQLRFGLLAELVAAPGEGNALAAFLASARETAAREEGTVTWYAFKLATRRGGIFDTPPGSSRAASVRPASTR